MSEIQQLEKIEINKSTLIVIPSDEYNYIITQIPQQISNKKTCYITLNKTYNALKEIFQDNSEIKQDNIVFIDAITKSIGKVENKDDCYFVSNPQALTELSIVISEFLNYKFDYVIFDSLTTLMIYKKQEEPVLKFTSNLLNKIKQSGARAIFYVLNIEEHKKLIDQSSMVMDGVINLEKKEINV